MNALAAWVLVLVSLAAWALVAVFKSALVAASWRRR
jgi:hypothetical protein